MNKFFSKQAAAIALMPFSLVCIAQVPLADQPVFSTVAVPGNLALALSVEFPTAVSVAHINNTYSNSTVYVGYFDPKKCYLYNYSPTEANRHFYPVSMASSAPAYSPPYSCNGASKQWSGNFLNWATMQTIDPFRWALTGGYRVVDTAGSGSTPGVTIIEKAYASGQGGTGNFPNRTLSTGVSASTPSSASNFKMRIQGLGNKMNFTATGNPDDPATPYNPSSTLVNGTVYEVSIRVKVCDPTLGGAVASPLGLESNCVAYGPPTATTYKPEGLMQKYADRIRYSAFGYLNDSNIARDGGVLRARQAYIGPMQPVPLSVAIANVSPEWDGATGVMKLDPLSSCSGSPCPPNDAALTNTTFGTSVTNSGVMNYLNKFGQSGSYKTYDPVGELYYAAVRYFKNLGNIPEWTNMGAASTATKNAYADGFPVITNWDDPILYSCQKNFILGIGDVNTHADKNVPGSSIAGGANEPTAPSGLASDAITSTTMTNKVGSLEGLGGSLGTAQNYNGCCSNNSALMAGIAYQVHTTDIRPDNASILHTLDKQTIDTYWLDVLEYSTYKTNNQFYLAAKYGGFTVPAGFNPLTATALPSLASWYTTGRISPSGGQQLPDNYFVASDPNSMINGLTQAFSRIAASIVANTTASATATPQVSAISDASFSTSYTSADWTSEIEASSLDFSTTPSVLTSRWKFSSKFAAQLSGTGWDIDRRMATWNGSQGVAFRHPSSTSTTKISSTQEAALDTPWRQSSPTVTNDSLDYLNYLRGDRSKETATPNYRIRTSLVGDIVGSKLKVVGSPNSLLWDEPGYLAFQTKWGPKPASGSTPADLGRRTVIYVGSNSGVLHAINGALFTSTPSSIPTGAALPEVDVDAGKEMFAYVPSALFRASSTSADRIDRGLVALGNPAYLHRYYVNATPKNFDIDLANTVAGKASTLSCNEANPAGGFYPQNWRTLLIGGLGKGGKSYYALDITNPKSITDEDTLRKKVMWEFPRTADPLDVNLADKVGFSYGEPVVVRTRQHGWVVIFTSGYNNVDGISYFFIVDPCTGYLLQEPIRTQTGISTSGMAHATAYVLTPGLALADAVYAGDLLGNVWRLDITAATGNFPEAKLIATLTEGSGVSSGTRQPVTTRPMIEYDPKTLKRFVMVGTGRLLDKSDTSCQKQDFYALKDGDVFSFDATLSPLVKTDFVDISASLTAGGVFLPSSKGWHLTLGTKGDSSGFYTGCGWRMIDNSVALPTTGLVAFVATLPSATMSDPCLTSGATSLIYGINFGTGNTTLKDSSGTVQKVIYKASRVLDLRFVSDGKGVPKLTFGNDAIGTVPETLDLAGSPAPVWRILNSREISIAD